MEGEFKDPKEMENIVVGIRNGASVYLRDVATVVDSVEERAQETYNNGGAGSHDCCTETIGSKLSEHFPESNGSVA